VSADPPWRPRRIRALALLAGALLATTALMRLPVAIWGESQRDFGSPPADLLLALLVAGLLALMLVAVVSIAVPAGLRRAVDLALAAAAGYAWVRASFFPGPSVNLNGTSISADLGTGVAGWLAPLAAAGLLAGLAWRRRRLAVVLLAVLLGGDLAQTAIGAANGWRSTPRGTAAALSSLLEWSRKGNVVVLILDTLQSDVFQDVLADRPELRRQLDGFRYYQQAASTAPTTYLSLPTILSGEIYDPDQSAREFFARGTGEDSVLGRLAAAGYQASYATALANCPPGVRCLGLHTLARSETQIAVQEAAELLDLGVYRVLPDGLRRGILLRGRGPFAVALGRDTHVERAVIAAEALARFASASYVTDSGPTAKVVHSVLTHPPTVLRPDCSLGPRREDRAGAVQQAECAFRQVVALFQRLRAERAYDVSDLVIIGDHGYGMQSPWVRGSQDPKLRRIVGALNPVVLVKPAGAHGPLTTSEAPVTLADIPRALCGATGCAPDRGLRALDDVDPRRERVAFWYSWANDDWRRAQIPGLVRYRIRGDLRDPKSWWREAEVYRPGTVIDFRRGENAAHYVGLGWGRRQPTHTWIVDPEAQLRFRAHFAPGRDYVLDLVAPLLEPREPERSRLTALEVNGATLAMLPCADPQRSPVTRRFRIPASVLARTPVTIITFRAADAGAGRPFDPCLAIQTIELSPLS
jgi:hypothetical protein